MRRFCPGSRFPGDTASGTSSRCSPCYLFVHLGRQPTALSAVRWTPRVRRILSTGDEPAPLDDQVITTIRARLNDEGVIRMGLPFGRGDRVRITEGPMVGLSGVLERFTSRAKRVRVLLDLMISTSRGSWCHNAHESARDVVAYLASLNIKLERMTG